MAAHVYDETLRRAAGRCQQATLLGDLAAAVAEATVAEACETVLLEHPAAPRPWRLYRQRLEAALRDRSRNAATTALQRAAHAQLDRRLQDLAVPGTTNGSGNGSGNGNPAAAADDSKDTVQQADLVAYRWAAAFVPRPPRGVERFVLLQGPGATIPDLRAWTARFPVLLYRYLQTSKDLSAKRRAVYEAVVEEEGAREAVEADLNASTAALRERPVLPAAAPARIEPVFEALRQSGCLHTTHLADLLRSVLRRQRFPGLYCEDGLRASETYVLVDGAPGSGRSSFLRDAVRLLGAHFFQASWTAVAEVYRRPHKTHAVPLVVPVHVGADQLVDRHVGGTERNLRDLFRGLRSALRRRAFPTPAGFAHLRRRHVHVVPFVVLVIDDADILMRSRRASPSEAHVAAVNALLEQLGGWRAGQSRRPDDPAVAADRAACPVLPTPQLLCLFSVTARAAVDSAVLRRMHTLITLDLMDGRDKLRLVRQGVEQRWLTAAPNGLRGAGSTDGLARLGVVPPTVPPVRRCAGFLAPAAALAALVAALGDPFAPPPGAGQETADVRLVVAPEDESNRLVEDHVRGAVARLGPTALPQFWAANQAPWAKSLQQQAWFRGVSTALYRLQTTFGNLGTRIRGNLLGAGAAAAGNASSPPPPRTPLTRLVHLRAAAYAGNVVRAWLDQLGALALEGGMFLLTNFAGRTVAGSADLAVTLGAEQSPWPTGAPRRLLQWYDVFAPLAELLGAGSLVQGRRTNSIAYLQRPEEVEKALGKYANVDLDGTESSPGFVAAPTALRWMMGHHGQDAAVLASPVTIFDRSEAGNRKDAEAGDTKERIVSCPFLFADLAAGSADTAQVWVHQATGQADSTDEQMVAAGEFVERDRRAEAARDAGHPAADRAPPAEARKNLGWDLLDFGVLETLNVQVKQNDKQSQSRRATVVVEAIDPTATERHRGTKQSGQAPPWLARMQATDVVCLVLEVANITADSKFVQGTNAAVPLDGITALAQALTVGRLHVVGVSLQWRRATRQGLEAGAASNPTQDVRFCDVALWTGDSGSYLWASGRTDCKALQISLCFRSRTAGELPTAVSSAFLRNVRSLGTYAADTPYAALRKSPAGFDHAVYIRYLLENAAAYTGQSVHTLVQQLRSAPRAEKMKQFPVAEDRQLVDLFLTQAGAST